MSAQRPPTEVIGHEQGVERLTVQTSKLKVAKGPDRGAAVALGGRRIVVGTEPDCDLVLADSSVSRYQFEVRATPDGFLLSDLGSTNGTWIGKLRVKEAFLAPGSKIRVGRSELQFSPSAKREEYPLSPHHRFGALVGSSPQMRRCFALLERAAATDSTVLIEGESGTGKELAAQSLHRQSPRRDGPFVIVDCGAIPANLIESELFGHEKGAFTGAGEARPGAFEAADGGSLFLDEVGEIEPNMQPKLLRFLESRQVRRVGANAARPVDTRVIAATNRRLERMVSQGSFREDLFYRLAVIRCELPALRDRRDDVPLLALAIAHQLRPDTDPADWLDERVLDALSGYRWPGNARELRNVLERLAALPDVDPQVLVSGGGPARDPGASAEPAGSQELAGLPYHEAKRRVLDAFERQYLQALLDQAGGVVAQAAERAAVPRQTLFRLIKKHGIRGT